MVNVLVLGASGMLGAMVTDVLARESALAVTATMRDDPWLTHGWRRIPNVTWRLFSAGPAGTKFDVLAGQDWVVNCIGVTKPLVHDDDAAEVEQAIRINAVLPYAIAAEVERHGARVIQIATDCVYSGTRGSYTEQDPHDPLDVYGKTKSLGEVPSEWVHHLRCSIVGPEPKEYKFLLEWFRRQPVETEVKGFTNHQWNGLTTLHFARICRGIITSRLPLSTVQHVVPGGRVSKAQMLHDFARVYDRKDIRISEVEAETFIDRTLSTAAPSVNRRLWAAAGYPDPPTVSEMIEELSAFDFRLADLGAPPS